MEEEEIYNEEHEKIEQDKVFVAMAGSTSQKVEEITQHMLQEIPSWLGDPVYEDHVAFRKVFRLLNEKRELTTKAIQLYKVLKPAEIPGVTFSLVAKSLKTARDREKAILDDFLYLMGGGVLPEIRPKIVHLEPFERRSTKIQPELYEVKLSASDIELEEALHQESSYIEDKPFERQSTFFTAIVILHERRKLAEIYEYYRERQKPPEDLWDYYTNVGARMPGMNNRRLKDAYFLAKRKARNYPPEYSPMKFYSQMEKIPSPLPKPVQNRLMRVNVFATPEDEQEDERLRHEEKKAVALFCSKGYTSEDNVPTSCTCREYLGKSAMYDVKSGCLCSKYITDKSDDRAVKQAIKLIAKLGGALARLPDIYLLFRKPNIKNFRKLKLLRLHEKIRLCDDAEFDEPDTTTPLYNAVCRDVIEHIRSKGLIKTKVPEIRHATIVYTFLPYIRKEKTKVTSAWYEDVKKFKIMSTWADYKKEEPEKMAFNSLRTNAGWLYDSYESTTVRKADVKAPIYFLNRIIKRGGDIKKQEPCRRYM